MSAPEPEDQHGTVRTAGLILLAAVTVGWLSLQSVLSAARVDVIGHVYMRCAYTMPTTLAVRAEDGKRLWSGAVSWSQDGRMCSAEMAAVQLVPSDSYTIEGGQVSTVVDVDRLTTINTWVLR